jgi:hypothetical protein
VVGQAVTLHHHASWGCLPAGDDGGTVQGLQVEEGGSGHWDERRHRTHRQHGQDKHRERKRAAFKK